MRGLVTIATSSLVLLAMAGCVGGAQLVLKSPIQDQCIDAGLSGCDDIAEGATLYADGKEVEGEQKLARGLRANAAKAAELKKFADGLELVGRVPGAGQYVAMLQPAIRLVQQIAAEAASHQTDERASPPQVVVASAEVPIRRAHATERQLEAQQNPTAKTGKTDETTTVAPMVSPFPPVASFWLPTGNVLAVGCRFAGTPKMLCLMERVDSPRQITDLMISPACPVDVLVSCRHGLENDWVVYAPAGKGVDVHSAVLPIASGQSLTIAIAQKSDDASPDIRCGVSGVWHALPEVVPQKTPQENALGPVPEPSIRDRGEPAAR